jgi:hypothetical protein
MSAVSRRLHLQRFVDQLAQHLGAQLLHLLARILRTAGRDAQRRALVTSLWVMISSFTTAVARATIGPVRVGTKFTS